MTAKKIFAIDLGNSGGKCFLGIIGDGSFEIHEIHRFENESVSFYFENSKKEVFEHIYWDDTLLYHNIIKSLQKYYREYSNHLDSIGIDTWGPDGQFITKDGELIGRVYSYRDHRLDVMIDVLKSRIDPFRIYTITGIQFQRFNISNQLLWFILNRNYLLRDVHIFLPMPTLFYYYLGNVKKIDTTWASVTQLMDARTKNWSIEILQKLGVPRGILPEIVQPGTLIGRLSEPLAKAIGLNRVNLYAVAAHDTASAFAAAPVEDSDDALIISSGTWSLIGKLIPEPITTKEAMNANISNEGGIGNIRCLKNCMGLWIVQELKRMWDITDGRKMGWDEVLSLVDNALSFSSFIDPDHSSFYNPNNMQDAIVYFCKRTGQKVPKNRGTFLRVVYESLALKYRLIAQEIDQITKINSKRIQIVGGGCNNKILNQFTANAFGLPVYTGPADATVAGNIIVQAMGMGIINGINEAICLIKDSFTINKYSPMNTAEWNGAFERFKTICLNKF